MGGVIGIVDAGLGNIGSIQNMLRRLDVPCIVASDPIQLGKAAALILPGVGSFDKGMGAIRQLGLVEFLEAQRAAGTAILGICLGMQLMCRGSEEGDEEGLGWLDAAVIKFRPDDGQHLRVPHMGWNDVRCVRSSPLLDNSEMNRFYFVHSYHLSCQRSEDVVGLTAYGHEFASVVQNGSIYGVQFHPEKSHRFGMRLLERFVQLAVGR